MMNSSKQCPADACGARASGQSACQALVRHSRTVLVPHGRKWAASAG